MNPPVVRSDIRIGTRTLSYLASGTGSGGRLAVFLHAFPLNASMWRLQLASMPAGWAGVAPDFRGFGGSTPDDESALRSAARIEDYAEDVAALLDALGSERAALCGCSMGGYAALAALRRFPERVMALLLADTRASADTETARASRLAMLDRLDRQGTAAVTGEMREKLVGASTRAGRPEVVEALDAMMREATVNGVGRAISRILSRPDATAALAAFRGPVTIVVGEEDALTPPAEAAAMAAGVPGSTLVAIAGAGHLPNLEAPQVFNAAMLGWLVAVAGATP